MKCERCGKEFSEHVDVCDNCGFDFEEARVLKKKLNIKYDPTLYTDNTDLFDFPVLSFILGLFSMIIPIFVFSIFAVKFSKKPSKSSLVAFSNMGRILGYLGYIVSTLVVLFFGYMFLSTR